MEVRPFLPVCQTRLPELRRGAVKLIMSVIIVYWSVFMTKEQRFPEGTISLI